MAVPTRITTFSDGSSLTAAQLNDEFNEIYNAVNGGGTGDALYNIYANSDVANLRLNNTGGGVIQSWLVSAVEKAKVNAAGQFESVIATGTAPLVIASTTKVTNLNADKLDNKDAYQMAQSFEFSGVMSRPKGSSGVYQWGFRVPDLQSGASSFTATIYAVVSEQFVGVTTVNPGALLFPAGDYTSAGSVASGTLTTLTQGADVAATFLTQWNALESTYQPIAGGDFVVFRIDPDPYGTQTQGQITIGVKIVQS